MKIFSFDTSAFIEPWRNHYPHHIAEELWDHLDQLSREGIIIANEEVYHEIHKKDDDLLEWIIDRKHFFEEINDEVQICVNNILKKHPKLLSVTKNRSGADVWVIAQAQVSNAAVVTYEQWDPNRKNIKIPDVCHALGIRCIKFVDFLHECNIKFRIGDK